MEIMPKETLRRQMLEKRNALWEDYKNEASEEITKIFVETFGRYNIFALYYAIGSEVATMPLIERLWTDKKHVLLPKTRGDDMYFAEAFKGQLKAGMMGIMEPIGDGKLGTEEIIAVPAICFDENFYRIGYGGGYYDKYLSEKGVVKVGISYAKLMVASIYPEVHDVPVDYIVTELGVRKNS